MQGNGDYIPRQAAREAVWQILNGMGYSEKHNNRLVEEIDAVFDDISAADVRPVARGEWVAEKEDVEWGCSTVRYRCSHCGRLPHFDKESFKFLLSDFCPKCGADMRPEPPKEET